LLFVDLVIITECAIIHFITSILKLFQVLLPNILVFLEILQHFGIAILTLVPIKWIYFFLLSAKGLIIFVSLRYLLYKLQKLVIIKWFRIIFMFFMLVRFNLARIPFYRFRQPIFIEIYALSCFDVGTLSTWDWIIGLSKTELWRVYFRTLLSHLLLLKSFGVFGKLLGKIIIKQNICPSSIHTLIVGISISCRRW
jgi:hypothetical protein